jgi:hypothetical protein
MISRLVTVDLILTMSERLHLVPRCRDLELRQLYDVSTPILNRWAKRIEAEGLSVSLSAITENALVYFSLPDNKSDLDKIGDQMIDCAGQIELFLYGERSIQPAKITLLQELEKAARAEESVDWFDGAKQIANVINQTEAADTLKEAFTWVLNYADLPDNSILRQFLNSGVNGENPDIPLAFVSLFKDPWLPWFKRHRRIHKHTKNIDPAKSA